MLLVSGEPIRVVNETYDDPLNAIEAAYEELKKKNEPTRITRIR
jgi:hypothetical protein